MDIERWILREGRRCREREGERGEIKEDWSQFFSKPPQTGNEGKDRGEKR